MPIIRWLRWRETNFVERGEAATSEKPFNSL